jgi:protein-tyrosine-phosphatase
MAEAIARSHYAGEAADLFFGSAGVATFDGLPPTAETVEALHRLQIQHDGRSTSVTPDMLKKADLVLCMTASHLATTRKLVADDAESAARMHLLDPDGDIPDPIGMGQATYDEVAAQFQRIIPARVDALLAPA